jgi:uncharacterized membrane protein YozB (DUF420 family)
MGSILAAHPLKFLSAFVCVLIVVGLLNRRRKRMHIPLMLSALIIDLSMVLYLEIRRGVVESIPGRPMTPLLIVHIIISVTVLVLYGIQVYTGIQNAKGRRSAWHPRVAPTFVVLRFANLVTSWLIT